MREFVLAIGLVALASCATRYESSISGPTATVTFSASGIRTGAWVLVQNFSSESCQPSRNGTRLATFTTTTVQGKGDPHSGVSRVMPAGQPAIITFAYQAGAMGFTDTETCTISQTFVPEAGGRYQVQFDQTPSMCYVSVMREEAGVSTRVPDARSVKPACVDKLSG